MEDTGEKKSTNQKRKPTRQQEEYVKGIKRTLKKALALSRLRVPDLLVCLEECYKININRGTLEKLFDPDNQNIDYACLVTVCTYFGIDMNTLLIPELQPESEEPHLMIGSLLGIGRDEFATAKKKVDIDEVAKHPFFESVASIYKKFPVLKDDGYTGDFKGYILPPTNGNPDKKRIVSFNLSLKKDSKGVMHAKAVRETANVHRRKNEQLVYTGVPLYVKAYKIVIMFLTDEKERGEFYFLSFGFEQYRTSEGLMFRKGLAVTSEAFGGAALVAQNFLIFEHEPNQDDLKYLPGLLKAPNNEICVSVEDAEELAAKYPEVRAFMDAMAMGDEMNRRKKNMFVLHEDNIISLELPGLTIEDKLKALLLLKSKSTIEEKYYYKARGTYSIFAKENMMKVKMDEIEMK